MRIATMKTICAGIRGGRMAGRRAGVGPQVAKRIGVLAVSLPLIVAVLISCPSTLAQQGTKDGQWPSYGGDVGSTRYAPLDQINRDNFNKLKVAWTWDSPDALISKSEAGGV